MPEDIIYSRTSSKESTSNVVNNTENSIIVSEYLSMEEINTDELTRQRQLVFICESIVRNIFTLNFVVTGSAIDCSRSLCSDTDHMISVNNTEVTDENSCEASQAENVLLMITNNSAPGYTLLKVHRLSQNLEQIQTKCFVDSCVENDNGTFLSSEIFLKYVLHMMEVMQIDLLSYYHVTESTKHGPCVKITLSNHKRSLDVGLGLNCSSWPKEAMEWITRRRESNWPDAALIDKIKTMPCHVMPVGCPNSDKCSLEWRFAFILQERELIWNLNDVQIQCYFVFKTLKKKILDKVTPGEINSFHLKTIVFWLSEKSIKWEKSTLFDNVERCLIFLNQCIHERHLSHYFLRSRNLFAGKLLDENVRIRISSEIFRIQGNIFKCFTGCGLYHRFNYNYSLSAKTEHPHLEFLDAVEKALQVQQNNDMKDVFNRFMHIQNNLKTIEKTMITLFEWSDRNSLERIVDDVGDKLQDTMMGEYVMKFFSIRLGMQCLAETKATEDRDMRQNLISEAKSFFETGLEHDVLAAPMYLLTYYFTKSYDDIGKFFKEFFSRRLFVFYIGLPGMVKCGKRRFVSPDMNETLTDHPEIDYGLDVVFGKNDVSCVPAAIQYECALLNVMYNSCFCSINPLVYACYVQFQVAFDQGDLEKLPSAVEHLRKMVLYVENGEQFLTPVELHRLYNILGYCYYVMNDESNAFQWFVKSLKTRRSRNAAALHLCFILFKEKTDLS